MTASLSRMSVCAIMSCWFAVALAQAAPTDPAAAMRWRLVGPFRAGWATVADGIPDRPNTFYFGAAGGGVWKTDDAGATWHSLGDALPDAAVGALAIAPSNPDVIYVGTGQVAARYDVQSGNGVYRSSDGGKTWTSVGLAATRHIGRILVDPKNPDTLLVGALGHYFGPNSERGVFRSTDGGKTWTRTLFIDNDTGVVDLTADPANPQVVYAAAWQVRNYPWLSYFQPNAGPGSGVYKSTDDGVTWHRVQGHGWPQATLGRIGLAATSGNRVYAVVNAAPYSGNVPHAGAVDAGGLYRSDDGGASWERVSGESWLENDYFSRITVGPSNRDRMYSAGQSIRVSDDGGKSWHIFKGAPGGDDYHFFWINPKHPDHIVTAVDQGAVVSVDGGAHWSDWYNQPTGQFYHLAADNRFPYWIYSGQQDSGTVGASSRSDYGALSFRDWHPVGGDERDYDIPDPQDANIVYGSGLGGRLSRWDARNGEVQNISPWPLSTYGERPTTVQYHYTWITPIAVSPLAPYPLYQGAQVLFRSLDKGATWQTISPDLSAKKAGAKRCDKDLDAAAARDCGYGVIFAIGLSPRDNDEIWIGTDDGTIQRTRDGGKNWANVTPSKLVPAWAKIASVDVATASTDTVYVAVDNHRQDDFSPRVLRTHDGGKTWTPIIAGLPAGHFVDVVRSDPVTAGLLYAGTDAGVYVSYDDGAQWQSLQRNLPTAWVRDLLVHQGDLIVATQGRAIWVLDDLSPLHQHAKLAGDGNVLFDPETAIRVRGSQNKDTPPPADTALGENPPTGAVIDYRLGQAAKNVALEIRDASGNLVRRFASDTPATVPDAERYFAEAWTQPPQQLSAAAGMHRFVWDLRLPRPRAVHYDYSIGAVWRDGTPIVPLGLVVAPGEYTVALTIDGKTQTAPLKIVADPRVPLDVSALEATRAFGKDVSDALERDYVGYGQVKDVGEQIAKLDAGKNDKALQTDIDKYKSAVAPLQSGEGHDDEDLGDIGGVLSAVASDLEGSDRAPTQPQRGVVAATVARLDRALARWHAAQATELATLNAALKSAGKTVIVVPAADQVRLRDAPESKDLP
ncbi:MAG: hypothetical protein JSS28_02955 [Proteobacteria bacterium]|nr:hypothetical protein [Pseudomonadota bacterium]